MAVSAIILQRGNTVSTDRYSLGEWSFAPSGPMLQMEGMPSTLAVNPASDAPSARLRRMV